MKGNRNPIKHLIIILLCLTISRGIFFLFIPPFQTYGQSETGKARSETIRVAFPIQAGLTEKDGEGRLSGYTYEYLEEIAQYTGWEYEFVELPGDINEVLSQMLEQLRTGKLDLMGGMVYTTELAQTYDYPGYSYGSAYLTLAVQEENTAINETNYHAQSRMRVAVKQKEAADSKALEEFCEMDGITAELVDCGTWEEQLRALKEGRVDAVLNVDLNPVPGLRTIVKFHPRPFYFAATKGNIRLISELNDAMVKINESDPYFSINLYDKYFGDQDVELHFTPEEQAYLDQADVLRVGVDEGKAPVQYYDENGEFLGISKDLFTYISEKTGLRFEFVRVSSQVKLEEMLQNGAVDLAPGISYDYDMARTYQVALTKPYAISQVVMAVNKKVDPSQLAGKKLALTKGFVYKGAYVGEVHWYETVSDCVTAVSKGQADYCYGNGYSIQYYANALNNDDLLLIPQSNRQHRICIGVTKAAAPQLINIINKTVRSLSEEEIQSIIYRNAMKTTGKVTFSTFADANPRMALIIVSSFAGILILLMGCILYIKSRSGKRIARANERYEQLCDLSNEYIFEYDYQQDVIVLSDQCAILFGEQKRQRDYFGALKRKAAKGGVEIWEQEELNFYEEIMSSKGGTRELRLKTRTDEIRWFRITVKTIWNESQRPEYCIGKLVDIQSEREERESLLEQARMDSLTGVYNAATSRRMIAEALRTDSETGALIIVDVDWFKNVNDQLGHFTGDQVLIRLAEQIKESFREGDLIGRLGGDEFVVFMKGVSDRGIIAERCEQLLERMAQIEMPGEYPKLSLSIGVALPETGQLFDELYQIADLALYDVKRSGRGDYKIAARQE